MPTDYIFFQVEMTEFKWEQVNAGGRARRRAAGAGAGGSGGSGGAGGEAARLAGRVREVLPHVPLSDILRDLGELGIFKNLILT